MVIGHHPGVLGCLAANEGAASQLAADSDAPDDLRDPLRDDLAHGQVVLHEKRLGTADDQVVDDHPDQVDADRVVLVHGLRDSQLGADAVRARGQQGLAVLQ